MGVEYMGRKPAVHLEAVRRRHPLIEPQRGDAQDFAHRRLPLRRRIVAQALLEQPKDRFLAVPPHANDERHVELRPIGLVEPLESGEFFLGQAIEAGAHLLARGVRGQCAFAGGFAGKVGMAFDERLPGARRRHRARRGSSPGRGHSRSETAAAHTPPRRSRANARRRRRAWRQTRLGSMRLRSSSVTCAMPAALPQAIDRCVSRKRPMFTVPMSRNLEARRRPHPVEFADVIQETRQPRRPAGAAGKPAVQPDRHHLRRIGAFVVEEVERVAQIGEECFALGKALRVDEPHVVGIERVGDDEVRSLRRRSPNRADRRRRNPTK